MPLWPDIKWRKLRKTTDTNRKKQVSSTSCFVNSLPRNWPDLILTFICARMFFFFFSKVNSKTFTDNWNKLPKSFHFMLSVSRQVCILRCFRLIHIRLWHCFIDCIQIYNFQLKICCIFSNSAFFFDVWYEVSCFTQFGESTIYLDIRLLRLICS